MHASFHVLFVSRFHVVLGIAHTRQASHAFAAAAFEHEKKMCENVNGGQALKNAQRKKRTIYFPAEFWQLVLAGHRFVRQKNANSDLFRFRDFFGSRNAVGVDVSPSNMVLSVLCGHFPLTEKCFAWSLHGKWPPNGSVDTRRQRQPFSNATHAFTGFGCRWPFSTTDHRVRPRVYLSRR